MNWIAGDLRSISTLLTFCDRHPSLIPLVSAVFTAIAAGAAWLSASASGSSARESQRARIQAAEPFLRVSLVDRYFTFAWRPTTGQVPAVYGGWNSSYSVPVGEGPSIAISNYGGGPALDMRVSVTALGLPVAGFAIQDPGGEAGCTLRWSEGLIEASAPNVEKSDTVRLIDEQSFFEPACGQSASVEFQLRPELLRHLLPRSINLETEGYYPHGTPANPGRMQWQVHALYRTALGKTVEFKSIVYAERVGIQFAGDGNEQRWFEKLYRCVLRVEPTDSFETTPYPVTANAVGIVSGATLVEGRFIGDDPATIDSGGIGA